MPIHFRERDGHVARPIQEDHLITFTSRSVHQRPVQYQSSQSQPEAQIPEGQTQTAPGTLVQNVYIFYISGQELTLHTTISMVRQDPELPERCPLFLLPEFAMETKLSLPS